MIFVNLPVKDLAVSTAFYESLGFEKNPMFSNEDASSIVISDTIFVMLLREPFYQTFTPKTIVDATTSSEVMNALSADSREEVDSLVDTALANGGSQGTPTQELDFMYGRSFQDPDGHIWEVTWMNMDAVSEA